MKKTFFILAVSMVFLGCKNGNSDEKSIVDTGAINHEQEIAINYQSYGDEITDEVVLTQSEMMEKYNNLKVGDTLILKFASEVKEVCQKKGCWMKMDMGEKEAMIRFKDYGFFMPKDIAGQEVIVEGKAYIEEMSVEDQRHYAEDGGKSAEEIAAILEPKKTLAFEAHGVLIPELEIE
ncbi:MAG TPA: DUF4920 domain-containing protein [Aequorivita sp.]|nr:DUF4920 domain-containing protein [Aequorivita sp.]